MATRTTAPKGKTADNTDVIVVKKSTLISGAMLIVGLIIGLVGGFYWGSESTEARLASVLNEAEAIAAQGPPAGQAQPPQPAARLDNVSIDDDPILGSPDAEVVIVEFSDFRCGFCARFHQETFSALLDQYGDDIAFVYRDFPVVGGLAAAEAAECAAEQDAFWPFHDGLFANPQAFSSTDDFVALAEELDLYTEQFRTCVEERHYQDEVAADASDAREYGVSGTPTFFINGVRLVGAQDIRAFQQVIDAELGN
ncbi:MAG: thioredoxin domain-containing protein [Chloroflexi bacterium]|nr:thioredoxin domain-containing protein [Chloroflexota bacterium]